MKIVFFGTPYYIMPILTGLHRQYVTGPGKSPIAAVVTQSPKPTGRKKLLSYSPVDKWAHEHGIPIFYSSRELTNSGLDFELGVLASYGEIVKVEVIKLFPKGILVVHPSLLPKYRGASPIPKALKNGDTITGVSIIKMDEKMDHGPIITQFKEEIMPGETAGELRDRLFAKSADVLVETLEPYLKQKIKSKVQNESEATYTKILTKQDGFVNFEGLSLQKPETIHNFIRAMDPWPGAWTILPNGKRLKLLKAHLGDGKLVLDVVQLEGKEPVSYLQFRTGYPTFPLN